MKILNSNVVAFVMNYERRKTTMFNVLGAVVYCIIHQHVFLDYVFLKKYPKILSFYQYFEETSYNGINGIGIPEVLMNIFSCRGFLV